MKRSIWLLIAVSVMVLGLVGTSQAYTESFTNTTLMKTWYLHAPTGDPLSGSIGGDPYRIDSSSVTWSGNDVEIHVFGKYPLAGTTESGVADFFFLNPDMSVKYGLHMSGTNVGKLVSGVTINTPESYYGSNAGYKYGGQFLVGTTLYAGLATIASGTTTGLTATISETVTGGVHDWKILLSNMNAGGDWNSFAYYVATGECNNSGHFVPNAEVPLPPSALLLGTGILGLVGLGWRRKKA